MPVPETAAQISATRALVRRALKQLEKAARALAAAYDGHDTQGVVHVTTKQDLDAAVGLIDLAIAEHGTCDVVVLTPSRP